MSIIPTTAGEGKGFVKVTTARPCPVCDKPDWCMIAADGTAAVCNRTDAGSVKQLDGGGWLHRLTDPVDTTPTPANKKTSFKSTPPEDWHATALLFVAAITPALRSELTDSLGLPVSALDALPLLGWDGQAWTIPECDGSGRVIGLGRRFRGGRKGFHTGGKRGLILPAGWQRRPGPLSVVEGASDVLAMTHAGQCCVGRPSATGGAAHLAVLLADWPAERRVIVTGENDQKRNGSWPGRAGAVEVASALAAKLGRQIGVAFPPDAAKDVRDWLTSPERAETPWAERGEQLRSHLESTATAPPEPDPPTSPPTGSIRVGTDEYRVNGEAVKALASIDTIYQRGGFLVSVLDAEAEPDPGELIRREAGTPVVRQLEKPTLRELLTTCTQFVRDKGDSTGPVHPPGWCVDAVFCRGRWAGIRRLSAVVNHPVILPGGELLAANGYHPGSRLLACLPNGLTITVPARPARDEVAAAVETLLEPLRDFPFEKPEHRAAFVAAVLTPLAWFAFDGPAPMFLIDANVRAAGKGLLADVAALVLTGRRFSTMSYPTGKNGNEELDKRITAAAMEGERMILLDNLAGEVGCDKLDAALTSTHWKGRVLGVNRFYDGPLNVTWFATGNNVQLRADTSRRTCHVRLESHHEKPEERDDVRHPDLRRYVLANRGKLLSAALTILKGWFAAGQPTHNLPPWGSFEEWSGVVREAVVFAGLPDPGLTREQLQASADVDAAAMLTIIGGLEQMDPNRRGLTCAEVVKRLKEAEPVLDWQAEMVSAVEELCGGLDARKLGYKFKHFKGRNFGGKVIRLAGETSGNRRWWVFAANRVRPEPSPLSPPSPPGCPTTPPPGGGEGGDRGDGSGREQPATPSPAKTPRRYAKSDKPHESRGGGQ